MTMYSSVVSFFSPSVEFIVTDNFSGWKAVTMMATVMLVTLIKKIIWLADDAGRKFFRIDFNERDFSS